jgi:hypothetical protein
VTVPPSSQQPPVPSLDSQIFSDFPEIFAEFQMSGFHFYGGGLAMVSKHKNFTADVTVMQTP